MPFECIFPTEASTTDMMEIKGGMLLGKRTANGFKVSRLVSTDPKMFLRDENQPGYLRKNQ